MDKEKQYIGYKLGLTILRILENNKIVSHASNQKHKIVDSLRKLAAASRVEYSIIQKISSAKRNPSFSTIVSLIEGLNLSFSAFASVYDSITDEEVAKYK